MYYTAHYASPLGRLMLASDGDHMVGLWIEKQKYFAASLHGDIVEKPDLPVLTATKKWLDAYFAGENPSPATVPLSPEGSEFRKAVWKILCAIPYGQCITYGAIAKTLAERVQKKNMSSRAVGGAVGHNPISIIIPCHRVVGARHNLTGYAGGIAKKQQLL